LEQDTPEKLHMLVAVPAAAELQPVLVVHASPPVAAYKSASAAQAVGLSPAAHVNAAPAARQHSSASSAPRQAPWAATRWHMPRGGRFAHAQLERAAPGAHATLHMEEALQAHCGGRLRAVPRTRCVSATRRTRAQAGGSCDAAQRDGRAQGFAAAAAHSPAAAASLFTSPRAARRRHACALVRWRRSRPLAA
jgi:hypothetical protein